MSRAGDGLMAPGSPDDTDAAGGPPAFTTASSSPPPPPRNPVEDADSSLTRKRPRLDSGSGPSAHLPAVTSCAAPDKHAPATMRPLPSQPTTPRSPPTPDLLLEMTIRSQPQSSAHLEPGPASHAAVPAASSPSPGSVTMSDAQPESPVLVAADDCDDSGAGSESAGVVNAEHTNGFATGFAAPTEQPTGTDQSNVWAWFPYARENNGASGALTQMITHMNTQAIIGVDTVNIISELAAWLSRIPKRNRRFFVDSGYFWADMGNLFLSVLGKRFPFDQYTADVLQRLARVYFDVCICLVRIDELCLRSSQTLVSEHDLMSPKHLQILLYFLRPEPEQWFSNAVSSMARGFHVDLATIGSELRRDFLLRPDHRLILSLVASARDSTTASAYAVIASPIIDIIPAFAKPTQHLREFGFNSLNQLLRELLQLFYLFDNGLQDPAKGPDATPAREAIKSMERLLRFLCEMDRATAADFSDRLLLSPDQSGLDVSEMDDINGPANLLFDIHDSEDRAFLIAKVWLLRLLKTYLMKGRMELRVVGIGAMADAFVNAFQTYKDNNIQHPVLLYLADFIIREQIVEYIVSVNSHPQLIQRSKNVVGFLGVTQRYSERQTDACWNALCHTQDPRFVTAIAGMLCELLLYVDSSELGHFFRRLFELPVEKFSQPIVELFTVLIGLDLEPKFPRQPFDWSTTERTVRPWNVCVRIIQDTAPCRDSTPQTAQLHQVACSQLQRMAATGHYINGRELEQIFIECVSEIQHGTPKATGSIRALGLLSLRRPVEALDIYREKPDIIRSVFEELCAFVEQERLQEPYPQYQEALDYRVEFFCFLIKHLPELIPAELYRNIWDHTVGKYALDNSVRDGIWHKFASFNKDVPQNDFCKGLISSYVPKLEPQYFTRGLFDFVASYPFPPSETGVVASDEDKAPMQIHGADLLWRIIVSAPEGTIENEATELLASRYAEVPNDGAMEKLEDAHAALEERCTEELLEEYKTLRTGKAETLRRDPGESMEITLSDADRKLAERRLSRIVTFERLLLKKIRANPQFSPRFHHEANPPEIERKGTPIKISYNSGCSHGKDYMTVGTDNTLHDLEALLCQATGFTQVNLFFAGQRLNLPEISAEERLGALGLSSGGHMLVQKTSGSEVRQSLRPRNHGLSVFETALSSHFEQLFSCMDSDDHVSEVVFSLLHDLPTHQRIAEEIASGEAITEHIFPPGKPFQSKYAAFALQQKLKDHLRKSTIDDLFLLNAIRLLNNAIINPHIIDGSFASTQDLSLASVLVKVLLQFLKERPQEDISSRYFPDEGLLVERLTRILRAAVPDKNGPSSVSATSCFSETAWLCYDTVVEASLHSRAVWEAFIRREDIIELHRTLLLSTKLERLRARVAMSVAAVCAGQLPSTAPLCQRDYAAAYWTIIMQILPDTVKYPRQSKCLFKVAEQVFHEYTHDENNCDEASLHSSLSAWSRLLLEYRHLEFVGRDEVDHVVLGLTELLRYCVLTLKSLKKKLDTGTLIENLFRKYLFPPRLVDIDDDTDGPQLPVLESETRKQLYHLLIGLADDRASHNALLKVVKGLASYHDSRVFQMNYIDRSDEIRSPTGYVGLNNPRALCYMNSLLSQLFMNINFRKFILGLPIINSFGSQNLLSEMQKLFAEMQSSFRKSADPQAFAACVKGLDGLPIDVTVQMDADEFYNMLFDQLEGQMLSPNAKEDFRSFFGGKMTTQIKSKDCEHVSETVENFFAVQCDVQGKRNLYESLRAFVEGDVMEGDNKYRCSDCGEKYVDAVKRTCLKEVPDNLLINVKRFDFDLETMNRRKINDRFEFPMEIDMSEFNIEHLSDPSAPLQSDVFELVGILVHSGTSENGHYYSYIRERPCPPGSNSQWVEFNDREVLAFDPQDIASQAFGGPLDFQANQLKPYSAYMLFYRREAAFEKDHEDYVVSQGDRPAKVPIPPALTASISANNETFLRQYCLHEPEYTKFLEHLVYNARNVHGGICSEDHDLECQALRVMLEHASFTLPRQQPIAPLEAVMDHCRRLTTSCRKCCEFALQWLAKDSHALECLLLAPPSTKTRSVARGFLVDSLQSLRDEDPAAYGIDTGEDVEPGLEPLTHGILIDLVRKLRQLFLESLGNWPRAWDDFFFTLSEIGRLGRAEIGAFLNDGFLADTSALFLSRSQVPHHDYEHLWSTINGSKRNILNKATEFLYVMLSHTDAGLPVFKSHASYGERVAHCNSANGNVPLTQIENYHITCLDQTNSTLAILEKMLDPGNGGRVDRTYPSEIITWMLENDTPDRHFQVFIAKTILDGLRCVDPPYTVPYIDAALPYCKASPDHGQVFSIVESLAKWAKKSETEPECAAALSNILILLSTAPNACGERFYWFLILLQGNAYLWTAPLLMGEEEAVRRNTSQFLDTIFRIEPEGADMRAIYSARYGGIRSLLPAMMRRIVREFEAGTSRAWMRSLLDACQLMAQLLCDMGNSNDPELQDYKQDTDSRLIRQYRDEVLSRLSIWAEEIPGTPLSGDDGLDPSEYSDSDDILEAEE